MKFVAMDDFKKPEGGWDFKAYHAAQVQNGEHCQSCGGFILNLFAENVGRPRDCHQCKAMRDSSEEVDSSSHIRCPFCKSKRDVFDGDSYDLCADGSHEVPCWDCNKSYWITTSISYSFTSPAIGKSGEDED